jgi:hypothetical protein
LKSGAVFAVLFAVFFTPAFIEILLYPRSPFFMWQRAIGNPLDLAQWNMVVYVVALLMFAGAFLYLGARLLRRALK